MTATAAQASWLPGVRQDAWAAFLKTEAPARTVEAWRRADFNAWRTGLLTDANLEVMLGPLNGVPEDSAVEGAAAAFRQDGNRSPLPVRLGPEAAAGGVVLTTLEDAATRFRGLVEPLLAGFQAPAEYRKLEAASLAQFRGGAFLLVPKGVKLERPVSISFSHYPAHPFAFPRVLAVVEEGAEASIVEEHRFDERKASNDARKLSSIAFSRLKAGRGSKVRYFYAQSLSPDTAHFWHHKVELEADAELHHDSALVGGSLHKSEVDIRLGGPGARSEIRGLLLGTRGQVFDPRTVQWHAAPRTFSDLLFRSALRDRARSIYTGLIRIEGQARGSEAYQQNNNLLLSNDARADSTPVLEILTDDVRCKHGATAGPVNADELFYLGSRGLAPEEAMRILVLGFFHPVLGRLPLPEAAARLQDKIERRLLA